MNCRKGLDFYRSINTLLDALRRDARAFVSSRAQERNRLVAEAETRDRLASPGSVSPPPLPGHPQRSLEEQLAGLRVAPPPSSSSPGVYRGYSSPPPPAQGQTWNQPPPTSSPYSPPPVPQAPASRLPPPPSQGARTTAPSNPYDFSSFGSSAGLSNAFATSQYPSSGSAPGQGSTSGVYGLDNGYQTGIRYTSPPPAMPPSMLPPPPPPRQQYSSYPSTNGGASSYPPPPPLPPSARPAYPPPPTGYANYPPPSAPAPSGQQPNGYNGYNYRPS
jgi:hypothetical protein